MYVLRTSTVRYWIFDSIKVLEMGPLRFSKGKVEVTFKRPVQLKIYHESDISKIFTRRRCLLNVTFISLTKYY